MALLESCGGNDGREGTGTSTLLGFPHGRAAAGNLSSHPGSARLLQGYGALQKSVLTSSSRGQRKGLLSGARALERSISVDGFLLFALHHGGYLNTAHLGLQQCWFMVISKRNMHPDRCRCLIHPSARA